MDKKQIINAVTHAALVAVSIGLGAIVANASTISPTWGVVIGAVANVLLNVVNNAIGKPTQKVVSLAVHGRDVVKGNVVNTFNNSTVGRVHTGSGDIIVTNVKRPE